MPPGEAKNLGGVIAIDIANGGILNENGYVLHRQFRNTKCQGSKQET